MKIWITSDTHYGHKNIMKHCNRPFENVNEMDEKLIENWNSVVKNTDTVYHLGDFSFHRSDWRPDQHILARLHGTKHLIVGNHDSAQFMRKCQEWESVTDGLLELSLPSSTLGREGSHLHFVLSHYPMREWNGFYHGSYHLFGHVHGKMKPYCRSMDVGVDTNNFMPYSLDEIVDLLEPSQNNHLEV